MWQHYNNPTSILVGKAINSPPPRAYFRYHNYIKKVTPYNLTASNYNASLLPGVRVENGQVLKPAEVDRRAGEIYNPPLV
jgi:hypothetical protein